MRTHLLQGFDCSRDDNKGCDESEGGAAEKPGHRCDGVDTQNSADHINYHRHGCCQQDASWRILRHLNRAQRRIEEGSRKKSRVNGGASQAYSKRLTKNVERPVTDLVAHGVEELVDDSPEECQRPSGGHKHRRNKNSSAPCCRTKENQKIGRAR